MRPDRRLIIACVALSLSWAAYVLADGLDGQASHGTVALEPFGGAVSPSAEMLELMPIR